jgi:hypothetical protein
VRIFSFFPSFSPFPFAPSSLSDPTSEEPDKGGDEALEPALAVESELTRRWRRPLAKDARRGGSENCPVGLEGREWGPEDGRKTERREVMEEVKGEFDVSLKGKAGEDPEERQYCASSLECFGKGRGRERLEAEGILGVGLSGLWSWFWLLRDRQ